MIDFHYCTGGLSSILFKKPFSAGTTSRTCTSAESCAPRAPPSAGTLDWSWATIAPTTASRAQPPTPPHPSTPHNVNVRSTPRSSSTGPFGHAAALTSPKSITMNLLLLHPPTSPPSRSPIGTAGSHLAGRPRAATWQPTRPRLGSSVPLHMAP